MTAPPHLDQPADDGAVRSLHRDPFALPSPARGRYLLLVIVMLLGGAFVGHNIHSQVWGKSWAHTMDQCLAKDIAGDSGIGFPSDLESMRKNRDDVVRNYRQQRDCMAPVEGRRVLWALGGALTVLMLGVALMLLLPYRLVRRAGPLHPLPPSWIARVEAAAKDIRLRRAPQAVFGSLRLQEPFTVGRPGRAQVVLPPGIVALPTEQADAIIRHELAHVRAGDVTLVWLTRGVWWALPPILLIPPIFTFAPILDGVIVDLLFGDDSLASKLEGVVFISAALLRHPLTLDYGIRAALLLSVVAGISLAVLRAREHEADLRAARGHTGAALVDLLRGQPDVRRSWWQRLRAIHPTPAHRIATLQQPGLTLRTSAIEAFVVGMLATTVLFDLNSMAPYGFSESMPTDSEIRAAGLVAGLVVALGWGTALWRMVAAAEIGGQAVRTRTLTFALCGGVIVGHATSIWKTNASSLFNWLMPVTLPIAVGSAGLFSIAFAKLWARSHPGGGLLTRQGYVVAVAVNIALFVGGFWVGADTATSLSIRETFSGTQPDPVDWFKGYLASGISTGKETVTAASLAVVALLAWRWIIRTRQSLDHRSSTGDGKARARPPWSPARFIAIMSGVAAVAAFVVRIAITSPVQKNNPHYAFQLDLLVAVGAGVACLIALLALAGKAGLAPGIAAATTATFLTAVAVWLRYLTVWSYPFDAVTAVVTNALGMIVVIAFTAALPAALLPSRPLPHQPTTRWIAIAAVALSSAAIGITILNTGDLLLIGS